MKHVMVDLETLGLSVDAVILSVGAVKFDLEDDAPSDDGFYGSISTGAVQGKKATAK